MLFKYFANYFWIRIAIWDQYNDLVKPNSIDYILQQKKPQDCWYINGCNPCRWFQWSTREILNDGFSVYGLGVWGEGNEEECVCACV